MDIKLYKKEGTYFSEKDQKDKHYTNFYIQCNDQLIPVEVKYFPNPKTNDRDPSYQGRFAVLSAFATVLPEKENNEKTAVPVSTSVSSSTPEKASDTTAF